MLESWRKQDIGLVSNVMNEKPQIKTVRVLIKVDDKASSHRKAGLMQDILSKFTKKVRSTPANLEHKKEE